MCNFMETLFELTRHTVPIQGLPAAFEGFTIAQISDLHIEAYNLPVLEAAIETVNRLQPDLVVSTGDHIVQGRRYLNDLQNLMSKFEAKLGKYACLGNHDYEDHEDSAGVCRALSGAEFQVLVNMHVHLQRDGQTLQLAGADDLMLGRQCLKTVTQRLSLEEPVILLNHNPANFQYVSTYKPDLVLSGHTHGGQFGLPTWLTRLQVGSYYVAGHYQEGDSRLYVNRGLGTSVFVWEWAESFLTMPTFRWKTPAEVSLFTLTAGSDESSIVSL